MAKQWWCVNLYLWCMGLLYYMYGLSPPCLPSYDQVVAACLSVLAAYEIVAMYGMWTSCMHALNVRWCGPSAGVTCMHYMFWQHGTPGWVTFMLHVLDFKAPLNVSHACIGGVGCGWGMDLGGGGREGVSYSITQIYGLKRCIELNNSLHVCSSRFFLALLSLVGIQH